MPALLCGTVFALRNFLRNCMILYCMYPHCTVRIRLLYAFNKYFEIRKSLRYVALRYLLLEIGL